jgi:formylglycine-generating enzyme required for sulfatase activity
LDPQKVVIPVLFGERHLPPKQALPDTIQPIINFPSITINEERWDEDLLILTNFLSRFINSKPTNLEIIEPIKLFICNAREDRDPLEMLRKKLAPLVHSGRIQVWYDREITGGKEWYHEISFNLKTADIVLLLISDDFFESDYIKSVELREALDGHARQENVVVPVILYDCPWATHPELSRLQALPEEAKPIFVEEHWKKPDLGFANVARGVLRLLDDPATAERRERKIARLEQLAAAEAEERKLKEEIEKNSREEQKSKQDTANISIEMVHVQGGTFLFDGMHTVSVYDFAIGKYPVTQKQWREIMGNNPSHFKGDELPVESVSWEDAKKFIENLNEQFPGRDFRLPSEVEWEYAARGGLLSRGYNYVGSNNLNDVGWFWENSGDKPLSGERDWNKIQKNNGRTQPVGRKGANELGIHDMSGNIWEWCEDDWHIKVRYIPKDGSPWINQPKRGDARVVRGGSWVDNAGFCRVSYRNFHSPDYRLNFLGFRLVSSPRR